MKISIPFWILLCFISACKDEDIVFGSECYPSGLSNGVIAAYYFSNGSLQNETSFPADLINFSGAIASTDRNGNPMCAFEFKQAQGDQYLATSNTSFLNNLDQFSISVWYQPLDTLRPGGQYEVLVGRNSEEDQVHCPDRIGEWSLGLYDCRQVVFGHDNSVWMNDPVPHPSSCQDYVNMLTGVWTHVVAVYNNNTFKLYYNGVLHRVESGLAGCSSQYIAQDIGDLFIGRFYTGKMDDILIYNREISSSEVAALYSLEPCCQP
jgi:Concanavalin A-like lectin/glucanases superfamily